MVKKLKPHLDEIHDNLVDGSHTQRLSLNLIEKVTKLSLLSILEDYPNGGKEGMAIDALLKTDYKIKETLPTMDEEHKEKYLNFSKKINEWLVMFDDKEAMKNEIIKYAFEDRYSLYIDKTVYDEFLVNLAVDIRRDPKMKQYKLPEQEKLLSSLYAYFSTRVAEGRLKGLRRIQAFITSYLYRSVEDGSIKTLNELMRTKELLLKNLPEQILKHGNIRSDYQIALHRGDIFPLIKKDPVKKGSKKQSTTEKTKSIIDEYFDKRVVDELSDTRFSHSDRPLGGASYFVDKKLIHNNPKAQDDSQTHIDPQPTEEKPEDIIVADDRANTPDDTNDQAKAPDDVNNTNDNIIETNDTPNEGIKNASVEVNGNIIKINRESIPGANKVAVMMKGPGMKGHDLLGGTYFDISKGSLEVELKKVGTYSIKLVAVLESEEDDAEDKIIGSPFALSADITEQKKSNDIHKSNNIDNNKTIDDISQEVTDAISSTFALSDEEDKGTTKQASEKLDPLNFTNVTYNVAGSVVTINWLPPQNARYVKVSIKEAFMKDYTEVSVIHATDGTIDLTLTDKYQNPSVKLEPLTAEIEPAGNDYILEIEVVPNNQTNNTPPPPPPSTRSTTRTPPPPSDGGGTGTPPPPADDEPIVDEPEEVRPLTEQEKKEAKMEIALAYAYPLTKAHAKRLKKDFSKRFHPDKGNGDLEVTQFLNNLCDERLVSLHKVDLRYVEGKDYVKVLVRCVNDIKRNISLHEVENNSLVNAGDHNHLHNVLSIIFKRAISAGILRSVIHGYTYSLSEDIRPILIEEIWEDLRTRRTQGTGRTTGGTGARGRAHTTHGGAAGTTPPTTDDEEEIIEDTETIMEFATDWTAHTMWEDAKYKKEELIKFTMEFYNAIVNKRDAVVTGSTEKYDEAIGFIQYNGLNNVYALKELLSSGMAIDPKVSTKFLRVLKDIENSQTEKSIKHINKIQKSKLYTDLYNQWLESEVYTTREEQNYKTALKSLLMKEKFEEKEYGYIFLGKLASIITDPDYKTEEATEEVLKTYFESRKRHYYTKFGIWMPPTNGSTVGEFFKQREDVNMTEIVRPRMAGSFERYREDKKEELKATREKDPTRMDRTYAWLKYQSSALLNNKKERKQELDKKVRQSDSWKIMKGAMPVSIDYTGNSRLDDTDIKKTKLEMDERGIPTFTLEGRGGFVGKVYKLPISEAYRIENILARIINDVDLSEPQKRVACSDFVRHVVSIATMKVGDLRGTVNGKNITVANSLGGYPQVIVDGKTLIDSEIGLRNMTIDYNELLEKQVAILGFLRQMITEKSTHHNENLKNLTFDNIKLSKAHKKLNKHQKIWKEVIKEAGGERVVWHVPETNQESLHCFHIMKSGSSDIYYSDGKFYIVRGVGTTQRVTESDSLQKLLQDIDAKDRSSFLTNYSKNFVARYLKEKISADTRIFFRMHGSDYSLRLDDAGNIVTDAIVDRGGQLKEFYNHTSLGSNTGDDKRRVKDNLSSYANQKQWIYNSQKDRGIAIVDYRQVTLKKSKWFKKPEEEVIDIRNDEDLNIQSVNIGDSYNNFYGDIEFIQALVKLADKTIL